MNLFEKHKAAIESKLYIADFDEGAEPQITNQKEAAQACTEITKGYMREFAEWLHKDYAPATRTQWQKQGIVYSTPKAWNESFKTTDQLLEIFFKEKEEIK